MRARARCVLALALVGAACRQIAGIDERSAERQPASCGSFEHARAACARCSEENCCEALAACSASAPCAAAFACLAACAEDESVACRSRCRRDFPTGFGDELARALACQSQSCAFECGLACGGYVAAQETCSSCVADIDCCVAATACSSSEPCLALSFCARACAGDKLCLDDCRLAHPDGEALASGLGACVADHCADECGKWSCLGHIAKPKPAAGTLSAFWVKVSNTKGVPLPGVQIRACPRSDFGCTSPVTEPRLTDENGAAAFMASVPAGFDGYFEASREGLATTLLFPPSPPLPYRAFLVSVFETAELATFAAPLGAAEPERGHLLSVSFDCTGARAAGVSLSLAPQDGKAVQFYSQNELAAPAASSTDGDGIAGFWNLPPEKVFTIDAKVAATAGALGSYPVWVRKGALTLQWIEPLP